MGVGVGAGVGVGVGVGDGAGSLTIALIIEITINNPISAPQPIANFFFISHPALQNSSYGALVLLGDKSFRVDSSRSPVSGGGYNLPNGAGAYVTSGKNTGYPGLHLLVDNNIASSV